MSRILIVTGGHLSEWEFSQISDYDVIIGVDRGSYRLAERQLLFALAIGDFDSVSPEEFAVIQAFAQNVITYPSAKDETDTELALIKAIEFGKDITIFGALGGRVDHLLANIHLLKKALNASVYCRIEDRYQRLEVTAERLFVRKERFTHVSLIPLTTEVKGISLTGFFYPLTNGTLSIGETRGISNYLIDDKGEIEVGEGILLVISGSDV